MGNALTPIARRLAVLVSLCWQAAYADQWSKTFSVAAPAEVLIRATDADVSVKTWNRQEVSATLTTVGWKISDTGVQVLESVGGNTLELEVVAPKMPFSLGRLAMRLELTVPHDSGCEIRVELGNLSVTGLRGKLVLSANNGNVDVAGLDGKLEAATGEGKIRVSGRFDLLTLRSEFGSVDAVAMVGSKMVNPWRLGTGEGNVSLRLPPGFGAELDAETSGGKIAVAFPVTITGTPNRSKIRGRMNGGGEPLTLRTESGNIKVESVL